MSEQSLEETIARDARAVSGEEPYEVLYELKEIDGEIVEIPRFPK